MCLPILFKTKSILLNSYIWIAYDHVQSLDDDSHRVSNDRLNMKKKLTKFLNVVVAGSETPWLIRSLTVRVKVSDGPGDVLKSTLLMIV